MGRQKKADAEKASRKALGVLFATRVWPEQRAVFTTAAERAGKTVARYVREDLIPAVATSLGIPVPVCEPFPAEHRHSLATVAAARGVSVKELRKLALDAYLAQLAGQQSGQ